MDDFKRRGGPLRCLECVKTHAKCSVCDKWRKCDEQGWTKNQVELSKKTSRPRPLVCSGCVDRGYAPKDSETYECEGCGVKQGRHKFDKASINNKLKRPQDVLFCPACKDREQRLLAMVQSERAWRCTCGNKRVQRKCMASCRLYPSRCRGCNLGIRSEDIEFLRKKISNIPWLN